VNWTVGELTGNQAPIAHIPPLFGRAAASYALRGLTLEAYTLFNGAKPIDRYSADGEDNPDEALPSGTPAWWTLNVESAWQLHKTAQLRLGVRNLLDAHYQVFSSGIAAPGRGLYTSLHLQF
jgi:hemoglobin/transferrin/lactoferrin receptor protein